MNHPALVTSAALAHGELDPARLGGKGLGLARLVRLGAPVPPFFVLAPGGGGGAVSAAVRLWEELGWDLVAVRSSALDEDGPSHSFAGMFESVLGVQGPDALRQAVATCRESAQGERVRAYRDQRGLADAPVAVVIQPMVVGEVSGVLFSTDPDDPDHSLVSAAWGLGEGVVQGLVPADTFRVDAEGGITRQLAHKDAALRLVGGHTVETPVDPDQRDIACLSDEQLRELARWGRRVERALGAPQDIEWTIAGGELFLLQARPITRPTPRGRRLLWDNSNIIESYYGFTRPLTYTFARYAYSIVYQLFAEVMGVGRAQIREHSAIFPRMIGLVRGRIYYNLNAWYRLVSLLPGYRWNRDFLEQMMGVSEVAGDEDAGATGRWSDLGRLAGLAARLGWRVLRLDRDVARFKRLFDQTLNELAAPPSATLAPHALLDRYHALERRLLWAWSTPIVNDFFVMIGFGLLRSLGTRWVDGPTDLHNSLLAGEGGLDSTAPTRDAVALAARIRADADLSALFSGERDDVAVLQALEAWPEVRADLRAWIDRWGDRCSDELKLEVPTFRQQPQLLIALLRGYLSGPPIDTAQAGRAERAMRADAEAVVDRALSGWRAWVFTRVLRFARKRVKDRENLRFLRTRVFGAVREIFTALGTHMHAAGQLEDPQDVSWLTVDEALGWVRGTSATVNLAGLVALRRAEYASFETAPADRFYTWGPVWSANRFAGRPKEPEEGEGLRGLGACPGVVEGVVRVVTDPRVEPPLEGAILVAYRTDPGWVPLFPQASGVLVERGSLLSHSAVVARELGVPTVVGIAGLTRTLRTGDRVRMDGGAGTVEILT